MATGSSIFGVLYLTKVVLRPLRCVRGTRWMGRISMHASCTSLWTLMLALYFLPMHGQTANTGAIAGNVSDSSGALVAGAAVVFVSEATREERTLATNAQGERQAPPLQTENATLGRVIDQKTIVDDAQYGRGGGANVDVET